MVCHFKCSAATITLGRFMRQVQATIPNLVALENNTSMHGDPFNLMKLPIQ